MGTNTIRALRATRSANAIIREIDRALRKSAQGTTFIQASVLAIVQEYQSKGVSPQPVTISPHLELGSQTLTGVLDRLERSGLLKRERDLEDRRAVRLVIPAGQEERVKEIARALERAAGPAMEKVLGTPAKA